MNINFRLTKKDGLLVDKIAERASHLARMYGYHYDKQNAAMDITACHNHDCKLDLLKLLEADNFNFLHDTLGIRRHLNRETGKLLSHFLPRCAR
jgi:hypothetical protein